MATRVPSVITTSLLAISVVFPVLGLFSVFLRWLARRKTKAGWRLDDWVILVTWVHLPKSHSIPTQIHTNSNLDYHRRRLHNHLGICRWHRYRLSKGCAEARCQTFGYMCLESHTLDASQFGNRQDRCFALLHAGLRVAQIRHGGLDWHRSR
jgi:hypothetical protein